MSESSPKLWLFQGREFSLDSLGALTGSWRDHYRAVVRRFASKDFLVVFEGRNRLSRTFAEVDLDVRRVLRVLQNELATADAVVTISENSYSLVVVQLAALLSGRPLTPLNPAEGQERLREKIAALGRNPAVFCFSTAVPLGKGWLDRLPEGEPLDSDLIPQRSLQDVAVRVFTSGSTGYSKVVRLTEANILANVDALILHHGLSELSVIGTPMPLFHVNALGFSLLCSFASGARLVLWRDGAADTVARILNEEGVKIASLMPLLLRGLVQRATSLSGLEYCVSAAAPLSRELAESFYSKFQVPVLQGFGLSEAVNFSLLMPTRMSEVKYRRWCFGSRFPSAGVPLRGNEVTILRNDGSACGPGEEGRICVRGWNVMTGYENGAESPFFHGHLDTGDIGFFEEGEAGEQFFFVSGRLKDVIKRGGETISLREIDDLVGGAGFDWLEAVSVPFANEAMGEEVGLACRISGGTPEEIAARREELRRWLARSLPELLRPRVLGIAPTELRNPSGKPLRWQLRGMFEEYQAAVFGPNPVWRKHDQG
ncbi:MAG: class I adenylate-forming enzyme family protein [Bdellovibrionota bacterium]